MANPLQGIFGPGARKALYTAYSLIGLVVGGIQAAFGSVSAASPDWLKVTLSVYASSAPHRRDGGQQRDDPGPDPTVLASRVTRCNLTLLFGVSS